MSLRPDQVAKTAVGVPNPANFRPADCLEHRTRSIRVVPPHTDAATVIAYRTHICTTKFGRSKVRPLR